MSSNPTFKKREKERARQERQREKEMKRQQRRTERATRTPGQDGEGEVEDPDIAGIVPGPQPDTWQESSALDERDQGTRDT